MFSYSLHYGKRTYYACLIINYTHEEALLQIFKMIFMNLKQLHDNNFQCIIMYKLKFFFSNASVIIRISGKNPGTCIQGAEHSKQLLNIESERDNWSYALYGLVGALCLAILMSFAFLYK